MRSRKLTHRPLVLSLQMALVLSLPSLALAEIPISGPANISNLAFSSPNPYGYGLSGAGASAVITGSNVKLGTTGIYGVALWALDHADFTLTDSEFSATANNAAAVWAQDGAIVRLANSPITASGTGAYGVIAVAGGTPVAGGNVVLMGGTVRVDGTDSLGLFSFGASSLINATDTEITAEGLAEVGVLAGTGGAVVLQGATVVANLPTTKGDALRAFGSGSSIVAHDTVITASGMETYGAFASKGATIKLDSGSTVTTSGEGAVGVVAVDSPTQVNVDGASIVTNGDNAPAAVAQNGGLLKFVSGASATANGVDSNAVEVIGAGSHLEATSATFTSATANGLLLSQGTDAKLTDTTITAGTHAIGVTASVVGATPAPDSPVAVIMSGGALTSDEAAIYIGLGAAARIGLENGTTVTSGHNRLAYTAANSTLALTLTNVDITGDAFAETGSTLDIALQDASTLHGMVTNGNMMSLVAGSTWNMTGDSDVFSLANAGTIAFAAPTSADFKTLTVRGDYTGNGGTLSLNTVLGGDASQTDKLVVQGNTSGTTNVAINNVGGAGAQTVNGIQVVQVGGASDGTFNLSGRAVAGAYEYSLLKGGVSTPTDGAWYLRSQALPPAVVPPVVEPPVVPVPAAPITPLYRPEAAAYLANQAAAVGMFRHSMHDRMGEPNFAEKANDDGKAPAVWARVVRNQMDGQAGFDQLDVSTDTSLFQVGGELGRWSGDSRFHFGAMGGTGSADSLANSNLTAYQAKGKVTGYNLGVYGTWFADAAEATGLYVDGWLQYGRYHDRVRGDYLSPERYEAWTLSASVEAGYAFALNDGGNTRFFLEPQAQAIYTDYSSHTHQEYNGTYVNDLDAGGLTTRLGLRFYGHSSVTGGNRVQPFATLNWWHDDNANVMSFNDAVLKLFLPRNQYELKLGAQAQLGGGWTGWGNLGLVSGDEDYRDVNGQVGVNYRW